VHVGKTQRSYLVDFPDIEHGPYLEQQTSYLQRGMAYLGRRRGWLCFVQTHNVPVSMTFSIHRVIGEFFNGPAYRVGRTTRGWTVESETRSLSELHVAQQFDYYDDGTILRMATPDTTDPDVTVRYDKDGQWDHVCITRGDEDEPCASYFNGERPKIHTCERVDGVERRCWTYFDRNGVVSIMKVFEGSVERGESLLREMIVFYDDGRVFQRFFYYVLGLPKNQYELYDRQGRLCERRILANDRPPGSTDAHMDNKIAERLYNLPPMPPIPSPVPPVPLRSEQILDHEGRPRRAPALETLEGYAEFRDLLETLGWRHAPDMFAPGRRGG
jgi:hypothetical protein